MASNGYAALFLFVEPEFEFRLKLLTSSQAALFKLNFVGFEESEYKETATLLLLIGELEVESGIKLPTLKPEKLEFAPNFRNLKLPRLLRRF